MSAKAARKQQREERRIAKERGALPEWERGEDLEEQLLRERRKRHRRLQKSLPESSGDQVERWAKTFRKKVR